MQVLVTGGASFIGSHLVEALVQRGARVTVADDFSSGRQAYLQGLIDDSRVRLFRGDLRDPVLLEAAVRGQEVVFHLAADHGGRGYVDLHQTATATNLILDGMLFRASAAAGVERVVYTSSACVYPLHLQQDLHAEVYLAEDIVGPPYNADNMYGWAKLMGEFTLREYCHSGALQGVSCRFFTVYGERAKEDHAIIGLIAKALVGQDPYEIWGTGEQIRNWTYVTDIVDGTLLAAERVTDGSAVNLGTMERIRVIDAARAILSAIGHEPALVFRPDRPTGPLNRVADNRKAQALLGWQPKVRFRDGLARTIAWYRATHQREEVAHRLDRALLER